MVGPLLLNALLAQAQPLQTLTQTLTQTQRQAPTPTPINPPPTRADVLRGEYSRYRANNDLLYYHLDIRVDPGKKWIGGKNTVYCRYFP